jgi:hypothetical protein
MVPPALTGRILNANINMLVKRSVSIIPETVFLNNSYTFPPTSHSLPLKNKVYEKSSIAIGCS